MQPTSAPGLPPLGFGEREWDRLWERDLDQVDRHRYGTAVWRGTLPEDALGRRVVPELARRWRRRAVVYASGWLAFAAFWTLAGVGTVQAGPTDTTSAVLPWSMVALGLLVTTSCLVARRRFGRLAR